MSLSSLNSMGRFRVRVRNRPKADKKTDKQTDVDRQMDRQTWTKNGQMNRRNYTNFERNLAMIVIYLHVKFEFDWTNRFRVRVQKRKMWMDRRADRRTDGC